MHESAVSAPRALRSLHVSPLARLAAQMQKTALVQPPNANRYGMQVLSEQKGGATQVDGTILKSFELKTTDNKADREKYRGPHRPRRMISAAVCGGAHAIAIHCLSAIIIVSNRY